jgi:hypothetical protein
MAIFYMFNRIRFPVRKVQNINILRYLCQAKYTLLIVNIKKSLYPVLHEYEKKHINSILVFYYVQRMLVMLLDEFDILRQVLPGS